MGPTPFGTSLRKTTTCVPCMSGNAFSCTWPPRDSGPSTSTALGDLQPFVSTHYVTALIPQILVEQGMPERWQYEDELPV
jgi:hypothetical protein